MTKPPAADFSLDAILHEHQELLSSIDGLRAAWNASDFDALADSPDRTEGLRRLVERLKDDLASHIAAEERGGYMTQVLRVAPQFTHQAAELKDQHGEFLRMLGSIAELLSQADGSIDRLQQARQEFDRFVERLLAHEHAENGIVQSAFTTDIGTGD